MAMKAPNEGEFSSDRRANGYLPLTESASPVNPPNDAARDRRGGSANLAGGMSPINPPNLSKFRDGDKGMTPVPGSAVEPGKGAIPVNPFGVGGGIVPARRQADDAADMRNARR
jgi:hypothetical protein